MPFTDAIHPAKDGIIIDVEVVPGAKKTQIPSRYNQWRKRIEVRMSQPARDGKANKELISCLAQLFDVDSNAISIVAGVKSGRKTVKIAGVSADDVIERIESKIG